MTNHERFQQEHIVSQVIREARATGRTVDEILDLVRTEAITHYELYVTPLAQPSARTPDDHDSKEVSPKSHT